MAGYGKPKSGKRNYLVIGLAVFVLAIVLYLLFFTKTPGDGTRTDAPSQPAMQTRTPASQPAASPADGKAPSPAN